MLSKCSMWAAPPATLTLASLTLAVMPMKAESLSATRVEYSPVEVISHDVGSKSIRGYYVQKNGTCSVVLMITETVNLDTSTPLSAARVRLVLQPGAVAGVDSAEGRSLNFTCGQAGATLLVDEGETDALVARQNLAVSN